MSDLKYRTDAQLKSDIGFNRRRMNEHKMRAEAAEAELQRRIQKGGKSYEKQETNVEASEGQEENA